MSRPLCADATAWLAVAASLDACQCYRVEAEEREATGNENMVMHESARKAG